MDADSFLEWLKGLFMAERRIGRMTFVLRCVGYTRHKSTAIAVTFLLVLGACAHSQGEPDTRDGLTKTEVSDAIRAQFGQLKSCHERANERAKSMVSGEVRTRIVIDPSGVVTNVTKESSTLSDRRLEDCVLDLVRKAKFPNPRGGIVVNVSYPFRFKQATGGVVEQSFGD